MRTTVIRFSPYGPRVKVVSKPAAPPSSDLVVMVADPSGTDWQEVARFNDMSNDFAFTCARRRAVSEQRKIEQEEISK